MIKLNSKEKALKESMLNFIIKNNLSNKEVVTVLGYLINKFKQKTGDTK